MPAIQSATHCYFFFDTVIPASLAWFRIFHCTGGKDKRAGLSPAAISLIIHFTYFFLFPISLENEDGQVYNGGYHQTHIFVRKVPQKKN